MFERYVSSAALVNVFHLPGTFMVIDIWMLYLVQLEINLIQGEYFFKVDD